MKSLLIILLFYATYCIAENEKQILKKYPKKVLLSSKKYLGANFVRNEPVRAKKPNINEGYTVFPPIILKEKYFNVPDSPYFQHDTNVEQKLRVKKVLPVYTAVRKRRSAGKKELSGGKDKTSRGTTVNTRGDKKALKVNIRHIRHSKLKSAKKKIAVNKAKKHVKNKISKSNTGKIKNKYKKRNKNIDRRTIVSTKDARRLIAAKDALIEEYPYVVSIQKNNQHWCAGALLNPRLVITTANCLWKANRVSRLRVRVGSRFVDRGGQMAKISEVMKHPYWGIRRDPDNDVALVLLDRNVRFSDSVHSVDLPNRMMVPAFEDAWITSWGAERRDGVYDAVGLTLQVYHARLISRNNCNNVTQRFGVTVSENFMCLAQTGKRAPCTRDTGAPAVSDGVLWGLASWGIRKLCGTERFPAVFSYIASDSNMDFIMNATQLLMADQRYYPYPDRHPPMRANDSTTPAPFL